MASPDKFAGYIDSYTVGWICALDEELESACRMLDEEFDGPDIEEQDNNIYVFGRIENHYLVIGCLPSGRYGTNQAAQVARDMVRTFPQLRFALMVGIGGGAPTEDRDIRLGDVVVSQPEGTFGGVIQYDQGKQLQSGVFEVKGHLNSPPDKLLGVVSQAKRRYNDPRNPDKIAEHVKRIDDQKDYQRPLHDRLYQSEYQHTGGKNCKQCDSNYLIERPERESGRITQVHYGNIASGNTVMKDAIRRDKYARDPNLKILCFEMEAAGLMNNLPCLVIRGISDYCDSHKNDDWHKYAALIASAYAREYLLNMKPSGVKALPSWAEQIQAQVGQVHKIAQETRGVLQKIEKFEYDKEHREIINWLTSVDYASTQTDKIGSRLEGTGKWLFELEDFNNWLEEKHQILLCCGIPGAGKTVISSIVVDYLHNKHRNDQTVGVAYIYCDYQKQSEQEPIDLILSLLKQLVQEKPSIPACVQSLYETYSPKRTRPSYKEFLKTLQIMIESYSRVFIIIDALDECKAFYQSHHFLHEMLTLISETGASCFATSRFNQEIEKSFRSHRGSMLEIRANQADIEQYLDHRISGSRWLMSQRPELREEIKSKIAKSVEGMFLLAQLYSDTLEAMITPKAIKRTLEELEGNSKACGDDQKSKILDQAYNKAMERIGSHADNLKDLALRVLCWITFSKKHLRSLELQHAVAIETNSCRFDEDNLSPIDVIVDACASLITVDPASDIVRLVHKTTQEYFDRTSTKWFTGFNQTSISESCLTYLSFDEFRGDPCRSLDEFKSRLSKYPFYEYAAKYWGNHAQEVLEEPRDSIFKFLEEENLTSSSSQAIAPLAQQVADIHTVRNNEMAGIHLAAYFGLEATVSELLTKGIYPDRKAKNGRTPLSWACAKGHLKIVQILCETREVYTDSKTIIGETPLFLAARYGHEDVVDYLMQTHHVNVNAASATGLTPLMLAVLNRHEKVVQTLLAADSIDVNMTNKMDGRTELGMAASIGNIAAVDLLLRVDSVQMEGRDLQDRTPLYLAVENGHEEAVELLLETGAVDLDCRDISGLTLLSVVCKCGHYNISKRLLAVNEALINSQDHRGMAPLSWAARRGHASIVELLLQNDTIDLNIRDKNGRTPLSWAADQGHKSVIELLLKDTRIEADAKDDNGDTPLAYAASEGHQQVAELLLSRADVHPDNRNKEGYTPLAYAARERHATLVQLLLKRRKVNPENVGWGAGTPILRTVQYCNPAVVKTLLQNSKTNPNSPDEHGRTALTHSVQSEEAVAEACVKRLLDSIKAEPNLADKSGRTPLDYTVQYKRRSIVDLWLKSRRVKHRSSILQVLDDGDGSDRGGLPTIVSSESFAKIQLSPVVYQEQELDLYWKCSSSVRDVCISISNTSVYYFSSPIGIQHETTQHPVRRVTITLTSSILIYSHWVYILDQNGQRIKNTLRYLKKPKTDKKESQNEIHTVSWQYDMDEEEGNWVRSLRRGQILEFGLRKYESLGTLVTISSSIEILLLKPE